MKILVGSQNPVKIEAVKEAFSKYFNQIEVIGFKVNSNVSDQPIGEETFEGAKNRALELKKINEEKNLCAKFFVGIEGGIIKLYSKWFAFGAMCIIDDKGRISFGTSSQFELPESISKHLLNGVELGDVIDKITGEHNTKQKSGTIGFFTKGVIDRKNLYVRGLVVALIPFINKNLYFEK
ncbi:MAG TPA: inosine/xanthosine triphosphatase [Candidatus Aenigmarchaeota archaeon]|nr:inosine/xanthosine triphosphatase [Candidatus Aenigmarchaeota archaeon]